MRSDKPTDHAGHRSTRKAECLTLLESKPIGRLGFVEQGQVTVLPVRYMMDEGHVVFRSAVGAKLDAALRWQSVAFEVDHWDPRDRTGWSVLVHGVANRSYAERLAALDARGLDKWVNGPQPMVWIEVRPIEITGRRIAPPRPPVGWDPLVAHLRDRQRLVDHALVIDRRARARYGLIGDPSTTTRGGEVGLPRASGPFPVARVTAGNVRLSVGRGPTYPKRQPEEEQ